MKRVAAYSVVIDEQTYINHVVEFDEQGKIIKHYPLKQELPHTLWQQSLHITTK